MENCDRIEAERQATQRLLAFVETDLGELPVKVAAGALMRTSVALAIEVLGPDGGAKASRGALNNILSQQRTLQ